VSCSLTYDDNLARVRVEADSLCVTGATVVDTFSRSVTGTWTTADTGQAYTITGDTANSYGVTGGTGRHVAVNENVFYNSVLDLGVTDQDYTVSLSTDKLAQGNSQIPEVAVRFGDIQNHYAARVLIGIDRVMSLDLRRRVANVQTSLDLTALSITHSANHVFKLRIQAIDTSLKAKMWSATGVEPEAWTCEAEDSSLTTQTKIALRSDLGGSTTNKPITFKWDDLRTVTDWHAVVDRTTDNVTYTTVRGATDVGITTGCELEQVVDDYEFPVGVPITYRVRVIDGSGNVLVVTTCQIEVDLDRVWLKSIGRPFLNQAVNCVGNPTPITRRARGGTFPIVRRSFPVGITDLRGSREVTATVVTRTTQERQDLDLLLASGDPIFVQTPLAYPLPTMYAVVGDTVENRPVRNRLCDADWRLWELPLTEVAAPGPDVVGSTSTWQTVVNTYATWADVMAAHATWADLLELIGDGSEVIVP
jgi:hypothetical protein